MLTGILNTPWTGFVKTKWFWRDVGELSNISKVCLTILGHYALGGKGYISEVFVFTKFSNKKVAENLACYLMGLDNYLNATLQNSNMFKVNILWR